MFYRSWQHDDDEDTDGNDELTEWCISMACKCHKVQTSVTWSTKRIVFGDLLDSVHIAIKCWKNTSADIYTRIERWCSQCVSYESKATARQKVRSFWETLGVKKKWLGLYIEIDPEYRNGKLYVPEEMSCLMGSGSGRSYCV